MGKIIPPSKEILKEAEKINPNFDINEIHSKTFELIKEYRKTYYENKVNEFISRLSLSDIPNDIKLRIKEELLHPISVGDKEYSNFMEEVSRRVSQTFQVISGNIAELCVERELNRVGLKLGINYVKKKERTDIIVYYPEKQNFQKKHRVEVKNVKMRERAIRGLVFDGDSMIGFFNDPSEFSSSDIIKLIDRYCERTGGYCYVPPKTLEQIQYKGKRFKSNLEFASDMKRFAEHGII